ncbi:hypothetical protein [Selenomonas sp.]|uniref:hypothetical protein n=1 Tax=Selenomonas sp. TaxID=2053611 RepID=UPI002A75D3FC|nr:hypothetical protein [Selenomonas sp.]MDY3297127.1 hypothetical protein [Selenomonas sp.]
MNINDIKAALAARAQAANVKPATPVIEPPAQPAVQQTVEQPKATRKASKKQNATAQPPVIQQEATPANATTPELPVSAASSTKAPSKKTTRKTTSKKAAAPVATTTNIEAFIAANLKPGTDFNVIPGCGRKPALLKAGAEHLAAIFGYRSTSEVIHRIESLKDGFVLYEIATTVYDQDGNIVAVGLGSCNSRERRYQNNFAASLNTVLKMAKKRSYVDAILTATKSSGVFTQDIDEITRDIQEVPAQPYAQEA